MSVALGPALLFCPADRADRFAKAAERADAVVLDLEDAVAPDAKDAARRAVVESALDPARTLVRVNDARSGQLAADLDAVRRSPYRAVMLAKTEAAADVDALGDLEVVALCETAAGVVRAAEIAAHPRVTALMWGAEDLVASIGGTSSRTQDGAYRAVAMHARSAILLAAGAFGKAAVDAVHLDIGDLDGCRAEAEDAAASGFAAKAAIHPSHVAAIRAAFAPSDAEAAWARRLIAESSAHGGVFRFEGRMVDEPVLRHARAILARTARGATSPAP
ncbi:MULTISPECIES: HpcH/HpaI aldolase/citrate lyase family protein [Microbacterium]|uniref:CoA ester lyase n=1 Tax=Microbacterium barkeri TaxID=33917 RepID=A0A9W6H4H2_9MICO|nr:CoA ester lyase [Microbacterium barkeri]MDR6876708.1 citrate lyase subunit beta/citryl-CoA lyase [Microbacterium barkeri]GLJ62148.1 CoA ester lyase [Microbacterium barkeri]